MKRPLTERQKQVYDLNQAGMNQKKIAEITDLAQQTISTYLNNIERKGHDVKRMYGRKKGISENDKE
tara:strand:- start:390 stop:590 length:201 start_codon:yes stop_codon:yes gene_type:complete